MVFKAHLLPGLTGRYAHRRLAGDGLLTQTLRIMKISAFFLLAAALHVTAAGYAQKITLSEKDATLQDVFQKIEKQTGYLFLYRDEWLRDAKKVSFSVIDGDLEQVLSLCFKDQPFTYSILDKSIVVRQRETAPKPTAALPQSPPPATNNDIHGRVTDSSGNPLVGASVTVKGTKLGTSTDAKGEFELKDVDRDATLTITYTGYDAQQIKLHGRTTVALALSHNNDPLDQVQVIAYGTTSQRFSTGNVTTVTSKEIEQQPVDNPLLALEGRVPGLFIAQSTGLPGSGVSVHVEGQNSMASGNDPLYVIDGVPYSSELLPSIGGIQGYSGYNGTPGGEGNPLSLIEPSNIESITVLKDADATAIYGSRGANGVILITTKKGKAGKTEIGVNVQNGYGYISRGLPLMNTKQYLQMRHEAFNNDGLTPGPTDYDINGFWDTTRYTNWQKTLIGGTSQNQKATMTVSGGGINTQYLVSGTYHKQTVAFPGNFSDQQGSVHFNITSATSDKKFQFQLSADYLVDNSHLPTSDPTTYSSLYISPDAPPLYNPDGSVNWALNASGTSTAPENPAAALYNKDKKGTDNLVSHALLSYLILPGLEIKGSFGYTNQQTNEIQISPLIGFSPSIRPYVSNSAIYGNSLATSWIMEPQITYKRTIGKGRLDALLGATDEQNTGNAQAVTGSGYNSDLLLNDISAAATVTPSNATSFTYKYNAVFGRVNYNWDDKYIVDFTARRDGSSRFGSANELHNFEAAGIGWIFSSSNFIQKKLPFISFGKLSGSYGTTGIDQIGDYQYLSLYSPTYQGVPYQGTIGLAPTGLSNPYLQWESTKKLYFSMELGFFKDRILFNGGYVDNHSSNELLGYLLPWITGFGAVTENFPATVQNTSWEFTLKTTNVKTRNFSWTTNINLTIPRNKLAAFPNFANSGYASQYVIGKTITGFKTYHLLGVDPATGVFQFLGSDGKPTFTPNPSTDQIAFIDKDPKFYGGLQNSFRFHGFELDAIFQFAKQIGNTYPFGLLPGYFGYGTNDPVWVLNRWQKPGDKAVNPRFSTYLNNSPNSFYNGFSSDATYGDASYIRLKNLSLSWQLPETVLKKARLKSCQVFVHAQNLFLITKFRGMDPESQSTNSLPPLRVITIGFQLVL